jgi:defect-in-organelle-trafficking protein DotD
MAQRLHRTFWIVPALLLAGCAKPPAPNPPAPPVRSIQGSLERSAQQIGRAWTLLDEERAAVHPPMVQSPPILPPELARTVDFPWNGPVEPLVRKLALLSGYRLEVRGPAPASPIVVTLHGTHTVFSALQIVGEQAGKLADIRVNALRKRIVLRYAGA